MVQALDFVVIYTYDDRVLTGDENVLQEGLDTDDIHVQGHPKNCIGESTGAAEEDLYIRTGPLSFTTPGHWHLAPTAYASLRCRHIQTQRFDFFFKKRI